MKTLKTLSVLAIAGAFAGAAFAGPGDAHPAFAYQPVKKAKAVQIALYRAGEVTAAKQSANVKTVRLPNVNPKTHTPLTVKVATNPR
jgi:hypothetical protein